MFEVYLGEELVFEGTREEVEKFCESNEFDTVLDRSMIEYERMIASGYQFDSFCDQDYC